MPLTSYDVPKNKKEIKYTKLKMHSNSDTKTETGQ